MKDYIFLSLSDSLSRFRSVDINHSRSKISSSKSQMEVGADFAKVLSWLVVVPSLGRWSECLNQLLVLWLSPTIFTLLNPGKPWGSCLSLVCEWSITFKSAMEQMQNFLHNNGFSLCWGWQYDFEPSDLFVGAWRI